MTKRRKLSNNLFQSIKERKWRDIPQYLHEAKLAGHNNNFALHEVCSDSTAPIEIVQDIYYAYPHAALVRGRNQYTPIYIAVENEFDKAVNFLAGACPEACTVSNNHGSLPMQSTVYGTTPKNMIDSIMVAKPETAFILDDEGDSAFHTFFQNWNVFLRLAVGNKVTRSKLLDIDTGFGDWKIRDIYEKICIFLKAADLCKMENTNDGGYLLHSALREESCHLAFCKLIIKLHPNQVLERDSDGNLPIHVITASREISDEETFLCMGCFMLKSMLVHVEFCNGESMYCCEDCLHFEPRESICKSFCMSPVKKVKEMVKELIDIAPQMAFIPDRKGNFPLHIAIHNQQSNDVTYNIFKAFPGVVNILDTKTSLFPFMLAAVGNWESEKDQTTITYQLLREDPHSVHGM